MDNLQILLGGERVAANWLFDSARFRRTVGFVPFDYLEDGEFDALALMHAFTEVQADHRRVADMPDCAPVKGTGQAADIDLARFFDNED